MSPRITIAFEVNIFWKNDFLSWSKNFDKWVLNLWFFIILLVNCTQELTLTHKLLSSLKWSTGSLHTKTFFYQKITNPNCKHTKAAKKTLSLKNAACELLLIWTPLRSITSTFCKTAFGTILICQKKLQNQTVIWEELHKALL